MSTLVHYLYLNKRQGGFGVFWCGVTQDDDKSPTENEAKSENEPRDGRSKGVSRGEKV